MIASFLPSCATKDGQDKVARSYGFEITESFRFENESGGDTILHDAILHSNKPAFQTFIVDDLDHIWIKKHLQC